MSRINLRGVIVPSEYDADWARGYIDKGIIIPESTFRANLAKAGKGEPLTVYVNSPGGSVFSAGEMVNAVREWKAETKQPVTVVLGALTASAASAFAIMVADEIKAHANAKMMFHGAWTVSIGGKEMHQDTAELLGKINGDIKARLVTKYGMSPETVATWFAEGREGWLSAKELVDSKLATEIIADPSDVIEFTPAEIGEIEQRGLGIAAFIKQQTVKQETQNADATSDGTATSSASDNGGATGSDNGVVVDAKPDAPADATSRDYQAGLAAGRADQAAADAEKLEQLTEQGRKLQSDRDKARAEAERVAGELTAAKTSGEKAISDCRAEFTAQAEKIEKAHAAIVADMQQKLATAQAKCERLVSGGMLFSAEKPDKSKNTAGDVDPRNRLHSALR